MRKLTIACVSLLLLTNIVVLTGVAYNRSGEPLFSIELTERELPVVQSFNSNGENSGTTLSLLWQILDLSEDLEYMSNTYGTPDWLTIKKLTELGFDIEKFNNNADKYQYNTSHLGKEVILVLEYQGDVYRKAVALTEENVALEDHEKLLSQLKVTQSRIYVVDAGLDKDVLLQQYSDKKNYFLARGEIGLAWNEGRVSGRIKQLYIRQLHVPRPLSELLVSLTGGEAYASYNSVTPPRYKVHINIGKRMEPWVAVVTKN